MNLKTLSELTMNIFNFLQVLVYGIQHLMLHLLI